MKVAIVGYGNVGKELEKQIEKDKNLQLVGIFSRRNLTNPNALPLKDLPLFKGKIDLLFLAMGSYNDLTENLHLFEDFDTVDSYDNHGKISAYKRTMQSLKGQNVSLVAIGWDPGILSLCRNMLPMAEHTATVWGEGISQGHSNALKNVKGVIDGVQFTQPKQDAHALAKGGETRPQKLHTRVCHVACVSGDQKQVARQIKRIPDYFDGYDVQINFCTPQQVRKYKQKTSHCGHVVGVGDGFCFDCKLHLQNNAQFTAKIMIEYGKIVPLLRRDGYLGAFDVLDLPLKYFARNTL